MSDSLPAGGAVLRPHLARRRAFGGRLTLVLGLWAAAAFVLALVTYQVTDWYVMTDELVYERLAISIARTGSLLPSIHGVGVRSLDQLYPALLAPLFLHGTVASDVPEAHVVGAALMTSVCIPTFLLVRRVDRREWLAWLLAGSSIAVPWIVYSSFLLTETVAYPAFMWCVLAMHEAVEAPSRRADLLALATVAVAFLARTELAGLALVLPLAIAVFELAQPGESPLQARIRSGLGRAIRLHRKLGVAYAVLLVAAIAYAADGGSVLDLSVYGQEIPHGSVPRGFVLSDAGHVAQLAFTVGVLPLIVGFAWLLANAVARAGDPGRRAFAALGSVAIVVIAGEVTKYDLGLGTAIIFDRYLFYLVPVVLLAFACAVLDERWPRWSLAIPVAIVCAGFGLRAQPSGTWADGRVNPDSPDSLFFHPILRAVGSRPVMDAALVVATVALTALFALAGSQAWLRPRLAPVLIVGIVLVLAAQTGYVFVRLFRAPGYSNRPLTAPIPSGLSWVDQRLGPDATVTMIPYHVSTDYLVTEQYWRDLEFWNTSVDREADYTPAPYSFTGLWFPKLGLTFDPRTGAASVSPSRYVVQSITDTRFGLDGNVVDQSQGDVNLIDAQQPWRASFITFGTYDDGWLRPGRPAVIRVFPLRGQRHPSLRVLSIQVWPPAGVDHRPFVVRSNRATFHRTASSTAGTTFLDDIPVCVPPHGYSDVTVSARGSSAIPGDASSYAASLGQRVGSIFLADAAASTHSAGAC